GLSHISVGACLNPFFLISFVGRAREEKNRRERVEITHAAAQFKAIEIRQPGVQQIQVEALRLNRREGLGGRSNCFGFNQGELQCVLNITVVSSSSSAQKTRGRGLNGIIAS